MAAELAVLPITLSHFNQVSVIGIVANLGVVSLATVTTVVGIVAVAIAPLSQTVASWPFDATSIRRRRAPRAGSEQPSRCHRPPGTIVIRRAW